MRSNRLFAGVAAAALLPMPALLLGGLPSAYDNTLTGLIPDLYAGLDVVSRELVGFIPAVARNSTAERAAKGEAVKWPVAPAANVGNISPAMAIPEPTDQTIGYGSITLTKARAAEFGYVGEEQRGLNHGPGYLTIQADQFAQALRTLVNEVETDLAVEAAAGASRGSSPVDTTLFKTNLGDPAQVRKILDDNGAPLSDRQLVIGTTEGAAMRTLAQLTKANEAADQTLLRQGVLLDIHGFAIRESAKVVAHTKGTASSASTNDAGYAVGTKTITLKAAGTGTILVGDLVSFAGDSRKYVVTSGDGAIDGGGTITIAAPGLMQAIPAADTNITVYASHTKNVAFPRSAIQLATRAPAIPQEGDAAADRMLITDPRSGLTFEVSIWRGYRKVRFEVALVWGVKAVKTEHIALLAS